jgi:hypothetical protein
MLASIKGYNKTNFNCRAIKTKPDNLKDCDLSWEMQEDRHENRGEAICELQAEIRGRISEGTEVMKLCE